jgi:undecaprenyl-diphosphatase
LNDGDSTSAFIQFMTEQFGRTNKWSGTYGPEWLVTIADEISALGSRTVVLMEIIFFSYYFYLIRYKSKLREFLITSIGGLIFLLLLKVIFSDNYSDTSLLPIDGLSFPSGHTMMAIIMYYKIFTLVFPIALGNSGKYFIIMTVLLLSIMIGISRLIVGAHTPSEVIAGFSGGFLWAYISGKLFS